ncbi:hypothetical protein niasHS_005154 [Heterodera schachtii]|uniref:G protein-coupled receptor n=1 Tax=Heterodera schachtii TaxID=97005 RepID=A0ABD2JRQ5_HETSC
MSQYSIAHVCNHGASIILDPLSNIIRFVHCALGVAILVSVGALIRQCQRSRFIFHGNLMLLIASVLCLYIIYTIALIGMAGRSLALYLFWPVAQFIQHPNNSTSISGDISSNSSDGTEMAADKKSLDGCKALFVPLWLSMLLRLPTYQHALIYPLLHFTIMLERARATLRSRPYESEGTRFGTTACAIIWSFCAMFSIWLVLSTLADEETFGQPQVYYSMISRYNNDIVIILNYVLLALVLLTMVAEIAIMVQNRKMQIRSWKRFANATVSPSSNHAQMAFGINFGTSNTTTITDDQNSYSLSRAYQLNENIVTLQLFLPLDLAFAFAFSIYLFFSALLRSLFVQQHIQSDVFIPLYELNTCFLPLHILVTVLVYLRFICRQSNARRACRAICTLSVEEQQRIYMQHLRKQWATQ